MTLKTFDPLDHLQTEEDCRLALATAYAEDAGDGRLIASTLGDIVKARAISQLARGCRGRLSIVRFQARISRPLS